MDYQLSALRAAQAFYQAQIRRLEDGEHTPETARYLAAWRGRLREVNDDIAALPVIA